MAQCTSTTAAHWLGWEDYSGACKDWSRHQGIKQTAPHTACLDKRTHAHGGALVAFLSAPCSRLPGATSGTNKRKNGSMQASHHRRVLCGMVFSLAGMSRATSMADARRTESGSGCSLGPPTALSPSSTSLADSHLGPVFSTSNTNRAPGARPQNGSANASDHSARMIHRIHDCLRLPASELLLRQISTCLPYYLRRYPPVCLVNWVIPGVKHG